MFRLHKWYLDVVSETGDVLILYAGTVEWGRVAFEYASVLQSSDDVTHAGGAERPACRAAAAPGGYGHLAQRTAAAERASRSAMLGRLNGRS